MKAVMMSIQPKWVEKILNGEKTIEVRKTAPKLETPFKVYIYCTKGGDALIAETFCNHITTKKHIDIPKEDILNDKVVAEFICDRITDIEPHYDLAYYDLAYCNSYVFNEVDNGQENHCLTFNELHNYFKGQHGYAWHISDLKIYDKPRELGEFKKGCNDMLDPMYGNYCHYCNKPCNLTRPPQSWFYVEEI